MDCLKSFHIAVIGLTVDVYLATEILEHKPMVTAIFRTRSIPEGFTDRRHPLFYEKTKKSE